MAGVSDSTAARQFVLDGSVALAWCFPDERSRAGDSLLKKLVAGKGIVPALWCLEVANALLTGERRKRLTQTESAEALRLLGRLPLHVDDRSGLPFAENVVKIARQFRLTAYDATYLDLAVRLKLPLATFDRGLKKAARAARVQILSS